MQQTVSVDDPAALWLAQTAAYATATATSNTTTTAAQPPPPPSQQHQQASQVDTSSHRFSPSPGTFYSPVFPSVDDYFHPHAHHSRPSLPHHRPQHLHPEQQPQLPPAQSSATWPPAGAAAAAAADHYSHADSSTHADRIQTRAQQRRAKANATTQHPPDDAASFHYSHFYTDHMPNLELTEPAPQHPPSFANHPSDIPVQLQQQPHQALHPPPMEQHAVQHARQPSTSETSLRLSLAPPAPIGPVNAQPSTSQGSMSPPLVQSTTFTSPLRHSAPKTSRRQSKLTNLDRRRICEYAHAHPTATQEGIAQHWGIDRSSVSKILKHREKWLHILPHTRAAKVVKHRGGRFPALEIEVVKRCRAKAAKGIYLGDKAIKEAALEVSNELDLTEAQFKASNGWLDAFKDRAQIKAGKFLSNSDFGELGLVEEMDEEDDSASTGMSPAPSGGPNTAGSSFGGRSHFSGTPLSSPHGSERGYSGGILHSFTTHSGAQSPAIGGSMTSELPMSIDDNTMQLDNNLLATTSASSMAARVTRRTSRLSLGTQGLVVGLDGRAVLSSNPSQMGREQTPTHSRSSSISIGSQSRHSSFSRNELAGPGMGQLSPYGSQGTSFQQQQQQQAPSSASQPSNMQAPGGGVSTRSHRHIPMLRHSHSQSQVGAAMASAQSPTLGVVASPSSLGPTTPVTMTSGGTTNNEVHSVPVPTNTHASYMSSGQSLQQQQSYSQQLHLQHLHQQQHNHHQHQRSVSTASSPSDFGGTAMSLQGSVSSVQGGMTRPLDYGRGEWVPSSTNRHVSNLPRRNTVTGGGAATTFRSCSNSSDQSRVTFDDAFGALDTVMKFLQEQPGIPASPRDYMVLGELFGRMKEKKQELEHGREDFGHPTNNSNSGRVTRSNRHLNTTSNGSNNNNVTNSSGLGLVVEGDDDMTESQSEQQRGDGADGDGDVMMENLRNQHSAPPPPPTNTSSEVKTNHSVPSPASTSNLQKQHQQLELNSQRILRSGRHLRNN